MSERCPTCGSPAVAAELHGLRYYDIQGFPDSPIKRLLMIYEDTQIPREHEERVATLARLLFLAARDDQIERGVA